MKRFTPSTCTPSCIAMMLSYCLLIVSPFMLACRPLRHWCSNLPCGAPLAQYRLLTYVQLTKSGSLLKNASQIRHNFILWIPTKIFNLSPITPTPPSKSSNVKLAKLHRLPKYTLLHQSSMHVGNLPHLKKKRDASIWQMRKCSE